MLPLFLFGEKKKRRRKKSLRTPMGSTAQPYFPNTVLLGDFSCKEKSPVYIQFRLFTIARIRNRAPTMITSATGRAMAAWGTNPAKR